jgi:hypothetical protein
MKLKYTVSMLVLLFTALPATAQEQAVEQGFQQQLTARERVEFQNKLQQASGEQERNRITAQYQKMAEDRAREAGAGKKAETMTNAGAGRGNTEPSVSRPGPSGAREKSQK